MSSQKKGPDPKSPAQPSAPLDPKRCPAPPSPKPVKDCEPELKGEQHCADRDREKRNECRKEDRPTKVVERTWYYNREDECEGHREHDRDRDDCHEPCRPCPPRRPRRPTRPPGVDNGRLSDGGPLTKGDIDNPSKDGVWVGPRPDLDLPYLFMRANPGDLGARPVVGAPFWESPDIFILAGVSPELAPNLPPKLGEVALAGQPNTLYAHVWNFGKAAANEVIVEFYWVDPALGISPDSVHLIAQTFTSLGAKGSGRSHAVVKCPEAWTPTYVNGGHECLLVRVWDNPSDLPGEPKFDASINRHVSQRNIHSGARGNDEAQGPACRWGAGG